jgi:DNA-binding transcriptional ArsR family regulator
MITKLSIGLSLAFLFSACAINRNIEVSNTYLVSNVSSMSKSKKVQWARVSPGFNFSDYKSVYVAEVRLEGQAKESSLGQTLAHDLRERVLRELGKKYPVTADEAASTGEGRRATLQMALSEIHNGNGFVRWEFGTGLAPTVLQVEGQVIEAGSDKPVLEFVRHRSFDGYPAMGFNVTVFSAKATHRTSIKEIARDIAAFLGKAGAE